MFRSFDFFSSSWSSPLLLLCGVCVLILIYCVDVWKFEHANATFIYVSFFAKRRCVVVLFCSGVYCRFVFSLMFCRFLFLKRTFFHYDIFDSYPVRVFCSLSLSTISCVSLHIHLIYDSMNEMYTYLLM